MKNSKDKIIEVISKEVIKGVEVEYKQKLYYDEDEDYEYEDGYLLDENLDNLRDAYREKVGLLTKQEIVDIRKKYGLSQEDLSILLGFGNKTIARYESNTIQDKAYDTLIRKFNEDYNFAKECLENNKDKFKEEKYLKINKILDKLIAQDDGKMYNELFLNIKYLKYNDKTSESGYLKLNLKKIKNIINLFAKKINNLYTVKLNKMLWYSDALTYMKTNKGMTGLVYLHENFGAMPLSYDCLLKLDSIKLEFKEINDNVSTRIKENSNFEFDKSLFTKQELEILDKVIDKFKYISGKDISDLMHKEDAYINSKVNKVIDYKLIDSLKVFNE